MDSLLQKKYDSLQNAEDFECWYLVKQNPIFSNVCYFVSILESYKKEKSTEKLSLYFTNKVSEIKDKIISDKEAAPDYRSLRMGAFYGLIRMTDRFYANAVLTDTYYKIKKQCKGEFENVNLYIDVIQEQIERIFVSTDIDEEYEGVRKNFRLYPVYFLYKILLEIGRATKNYSVSISEYFFFITTAARYDSYLDAISQILEWRIALQRDKNQFDLLKNKIDNRFIQALKQLKTLKIDGSRISLVQEYISEIERKVFIFEQIKNKSTSNKDEKFIENYTQKIYYGVPGCGKSHTITTMLKDEKAKDPTFSEENQVVRTTFHPEYTNADFIGQILPEVHEDSQGKSVVEYKFKPGPFAKILKQALHNPSRPFYLVIEEINRGNAAAIFGDVFQLLDRLKNGDTSKEPVGTDGFENHYGKGWSEYFVMNADVNAFIRDAKSDNELDTKSIDVSGIHFSSSTGLRLPPNLSIYATMNTSDQNVFTLDNAFQRRWDMELVPNICKWNDEDHKNQAKSKIGDTDIRWETFRKAINSEISDGDFFNADDKQLGLFFIEAEDDKIDGKKFANKVLKYLWADVFKRDTGKIFKSENLSKVVEDFTGTDAFDKVFVEDFTQSLKNANDEIKNHE